MLKLSFSDHDIDRLHYERFHHPHPRVQLTMEALYLKSQGLAHKQIGELVGVCQNTLVAYLRQYQHGGVESLKELHFYEPPSALDPYRESLEAYFRSHPERGHPVGESDLRQRRDGLPAAAKTATTGEEKPITLVLDNARYQCCHFVQGVAASLNIELLFSAVFPQPQPHRARVEVCEEASPGESPSQRLRFVHCYYDPPCCGHEDPANMELPDV